MVGGGGGGGEGGGGGGGGGGGDGETCITRSVGQPSHDSQVLVSLTRQYMPSPVNKD